MSAVRRSLLHVSAHVQTAALPMFGKEEGVIVVAVADAIILGLPVPSHSEGFCVGIRRSLGDF